MDRADPTTSVGDGRDARDDELERLAEAARGGDRDAVARLVEEVDRDGIARRYVASLLADRDAVDEVANDVLITVAGSITSFRGDARFTTWLHTIAQRRVVDHLRRRRATVALPHDLPASQRMSSMIATREAVRDTLARLPDTYRQAVTMRDVEGLGYDEIAERTGRNASTCRSHVARGRALVAAMIELPGTWS